MKNIIRKLYKRFDKFLEQAASGNLKLKARITAILTGILIFVVVILSAIAAFVEFEITVPVFGAINRIINETTVESKVLVNSRYRELVESGQNVKVWILDNGKIPLQAEVTRIEEIVVGGDFSAYLENLVPFPIAINEDIINKKIKCRIIIDKKKVYKLLLK